MVFRSPKEQYDCYRLCISDNGSNCHKKSAKPIKNEKIKVEKPYSKIHFNKNIPSDKSPITKWNEEEHVAISTHFFTGVASCRYQGSANKPWWHRDRRVPWSQMKRNMIKNCVNDITYLDETEIDGFRGAKCKLSMVWL